MTEWSVSYWVPDNFSTAEFGRWVEVKAQTEQDAVELATVLCDAGYRAEIEEQSDD